MSGLVPISIISVKKLLQSCLSGPLQTQIFTTVDLRLWCSFSAFVIGNDKAVPAERAFRMLRTAKVLTMKNPSTKVSK